MMEVDKNKQVPETEKNEDFITNLDDEIFGDELIKKLEECNKFKHKLEYFSSNIFISSFKYIKKYKDEAGKKREILIFRTQIKDNVEYSYINSERRLEASHILNIINRGENNAKHKQSSIY